MSYVKYALSDRQKRIAEYMDEGKLSATAIAKELGTDDGSIRRSIRTLKARAARQGESPEHDMTHAVPDGYHVKGTSTLYDEHGKPRMQWVKSSIDRERQEELMREVVEAMKSDIPQIKSAPPPENPEKDIIPWINIGDAHIGMLAHEAETGANFDLKIAEQELCAAISLLIDQTGEHERCVINDLGDATHYENFAGVTEASGHALDYDGRFPKMVRVYVRIMRFIIEKALSKFGNVDVIVNQGNHSRTNDIWMPELIKAAYGHTGRVHIVNNGSIFVAYRMGNTFVMTHHSDKCKPDRLASVMATDFREHWGETEYHYIDIGHIHHKMTSKEHPGVMIESFNILAASDKHAHDNGYRSRQSITIIERSRSYGELQRRTLPIQRVRDHIRSLGGHPYEPKGKSVFSV